MSNVLLLTREEVVRYNHFVSLHHELVHQVTAHETRTSSHENLHPLVIRQLGSLHDEGSRRGGNGLGGQHVTLFHDPLLNIRHALCDGVVGESSGWLGVDGPEVRLLLRDGVVFVGRETVHDLVDLHLDEEDWQKNVAKEDAKREDQQRLSAEERRGGAIRAATATHRRGGDSHFCLGMVLGDATAIGR